MVINKEYLDCAYEEGERITEWPGAIRLVQKTLPPLSLPSGQIVACDPLTCPESSPLDLKVNPGRYPLVLTIAHIGNDQRVAFARLEFTSQRPTSWLHVCLPGQNLATLKEDEYFGYPVDSGTGCFMDPAAAEALWDRMNREEDYFDNIIQEMDKTYVHTWSWAVITPTPNAALEVACFSSGGGDGMYPCFVGKDEAGQPVCLLTDFMVFGLHSDSP